jgi:hypothetical protein
MAEQVEKVGEVVRIAEDYYFVITTGNMYLTRTYCEAGERFNHEGIVRKVESLDDAINQTRKRTGYR